MLTIWDILGISILTGPLLLVVMALTYVYVRAGIEELVDKTKEHASQKNMDLGKHVTLDRRMKKYIDELARRRTKETRTPVFIKWFARMTVAPFTLITFEALRVEYFVLLHGLPYFPHALIIAMLGLSIVIVSIYYGFFVEYE